MPDILIRGLDVKTVNRLKAAAKRNGRSLQSEVKRILVSGAGASMAESLAAAREWRQKLGKSFKSSADLIREDRDR
jgi:plasmid stability protein